MNTELLLVRHGETNGNIGGLLHGRTDLPLTRDGQIQADRLAERIASNPDLSGIYSSPLFRARQTANAISRRLGLPIVTDDRLAEFDFGDFEGLSFADLQVRYPECYLSLIDPEWFSHPFPNGESRKQLHDRVVSAVESVVNANRGRRVVIVAHLIVIGSALAHLTSGNPNDLIQYLVRNASLSHVSIDRSGTVSLCALDDVSHLEIE